MSGFSHSAVQDSKKFYYLQKFCPKNVNLLKHISTFARNLHLWQDFIYTFLFALHDAFTVDSTVPLFLV